MTVSERPLRADAERNRRRIMDAARELFAARGLDVTLNDIARHAGVGVGTVYRRFPDKEVLIEALFEERVAELEAIAIAGLAMADPWEGIVATLTGVLELQEADRGLKELILSVDRRREGIAPIRARMAPVVAELMARAKAAGQLREDIGPQDFPLLQILLGAVIDVSRDAVARPVAALSRADPAGHARRARPTGAAARRGARLRADGRGAALLAPAAARLSARQPAAARLACSKAARNAPPSPAARRSRWPAIRRRNATPDGHPRTRRGARSRARPRARSRCAAPVRSPPGRASTQVSRSRRPRRTAAVWR